MARTTLNLDNAVLADLKRIQRKEGKPLGALASELLATAIAARKSDAAPPARLEWVSRSMGALVDLDDKAAVMEILSQAVGIDDRRERLARYATWTSEDLAEVEDSVAAQRAIDDPQRR
jgi:hypothetical protein